MCSPLSLWLNCSGSVSKTSKQITLLKTYFSGHFRGEKPEALKPAAAGKEAVIKLRSGSGSAYWLVCVCLCMHACLSIVFFLSAFTPRVSNSLFVFTDLACMCTFFQWYSCIRAPCCACSEQQVSWSSLRQFIRLTVMKQSQWSWTHTALHPVTQFAR